MAKKGSKKKASGTLMGMRSGLQKAAGRGKKRKRKSKGNDEISFQTVFTVLALISLAIVVLWKLNQ